MIYNIIATQQNLTVMLMTANHSVKIREIKQGRRQRFRPGWAKFGAKRRKNFSFAHPGFQFAHPAIRNGCPPCPPYRGGFKRKGLVGH